MSEASREATAEEWADMLLKRWGLNDSQLSRATPAKLRRELTRALQAAINRGKIKMTGIDGRQ